MLEAVGFSGETSAVLEDEGDFDDPGCTSCHEGVAEYRVDHCTELEILGMSTHGPACKEDHKTGNQVSFRSSAS